jgi:putative endonuclease
MQQTMSKQNEIGKKGEDLAVTYLEQKGYTILERNWRFSRAELDIIAEKDNVWVFIEVKARSYNYYGEPENSVDNQKEYMTAEAAAAYMREKNYEWEIRFDIVSILLPANEEPIIKHYEDAFFPGL